MSLTTTCCVNPRAPTAPRTSTLPLASNSDEEDSTSPLIPVMKSAIGTHEKNEMRHEENGPVRGFENSNHKSETGHEEMGIVNRSENNNHKSETGHEEKGSVNQSENSNEESAEKKGVASL